MNYLIERIQLKNHYEGISIDHVGVSNPESSASSVSKAAAKRSKEKAPEVRVFSSKQGKADDEKRHVAQQAAKNRKLQEQQLILEQRL